MEIQYAGYYFVLVDITARFLIWMLATLTIAAIADPLLYR